MNCIAEGSGKTGKTWTVTGKYFQLKRPPFGILENLTKLGKKNIESICSFFNSIGYVVLTPVLESSRYGSAARRSRQYFFVYMVDTECINQQNMEPPEWARLTLDALATFEISQGKLETFLFPCVLPIRQSCAADETSKKRKVGTGQAMM